jgi:hypothetical protein
VVSQFSVNQMAIDFDLQMTEVFWLINESTYEKELNIWMDNAKSGRAESDTYYIKLILRGVDVPIQKMVYSIHDIEKNLRGWILRGEEVIHTFANGKVTIDDYGFSSNTICGSIDLKDDNGTLVVGIFNTVLTSF